MNQIEEKLEEVYREGKRREEIMKQELKNRSFKKKVKDFFTHFTFSSLLHYLWKAFVFIYILFAPIPIFMLIIGSFGIGGTWFFRSWSPYRDFDSLLCLIVAIVLSLIWYFIFLIERKSGDFFLDN